MPRLPASPYQREVTISTEQNIERRKVFFKTRLILRMFKFQALQLLCLHFDMPRHFSPLIIPRGRAPFYER